MFFLANFVGAGMKLVTVTALVSQVGAFDLVAHRPDSSKWARTQCGGPSGKADIPSKWALNVSADKQPWTAYPRPQMVRGSGASMDSLRDQGDPDTWANLNGMWEWEKATSDIPAFGKALSGSILVPYPVEACLSGVAPQKSADIVKQMWYRIAFDRPKVNTDSKVLLHFGAVDWKTTVYFNSVNIGNHTGGYDGFSFDVTDHIAASNELLIYVFDPSDSGAQPNGKQRISAIDKPGGDTYTPNSGIWQTVWLEQVPQEYMQGLKIDQASEDTLKFTVHSDSSQPFAFEILDDGTSLGKSAASPNTQVTYKIQSPKLWSPASPHLYDLVITMPGGDKVTSYFGLRTFQIGSTGNYTVPEGPYEIGLDRQGADMATCGPLGCVLEKSATNKDCEAKCKDTPGCVAYVFAPADCSGKAGPICWLKYAVTGGRKRSCRNFQVIAHDQISTRPLLNGKFTFLAGFLDQSWWPDGQYTAPNDEALEYDLTATKMFGLNMIRLHQKVNPERWYYHADRKGLVIFQDMIQKYGNPSAATIPFFVDDLKAMIAGRGNHPCIVQWTTFNERDCYEAFKTPPYDVKGIVDFARNLDPSRLVDTDSGGGANKLHVGDVNDIHSYPYPKDLQPSKTQYAMVGEFGGIGAFVAGKEWVPNKCFTYLHVNTPHDEANKYVEMAKTILSRVDHLSASVYTQTTDLELECDGFLNYDRSNKFSDADTKAIADANQAIIKASEYSNRIVV